MDKTEFQKQEQRNIIIITNLSEVEKMVKVSKQLDKAVFGANKEEAGEGKNFKKFGTHGGRSQRRGSHQRRPSSRPGLRASSRAARWRRLGRTWTP